jgi:hypothetical protein
VKDVAKFILTDNDKDWIVVISTDEDIVLPVGILTTLSPIAVDAINTWGQTLPSSMPLLEMRLEKHDTTGLCNDTTK